MKYKVTQETELLNFLLEATSKKRNDLKKALKFNQVLVNGKSESYHAFLLHAGDEVELGKKSRQDLPFPILYEDKEIIVINKPSGLVSEQTMHNKSETAFMIVNGYLKKKKEKAYLVHRLDQDTSGVMMFVKNKKLYEELTHNWNDYVLERSYQAIVEGTIKKDGRIENYLSENKMQKVYVSNKKGKKAITNYHVLKNVKGYTLLDVFIETGRKNQIRVHMSSLGHPIAGDRKYGAQTNPIRRLALHANIFAFEHPFTHKTMTFKTEMPETFSKVTGKIKK